MQENSASVHCFGVPSLRRPFTTQMHYAENECAMSIRLHCNELRALCLTTNALCRTAEFGALLLKCVLIVYIWRKRGVDVKRRDTEPEIAHSARSRNIQLDRRSRRTFLFGLAPESKPELSKKLWLRKRWSKINSSIGRQRPEVSQSHPEPEPPPTLLAAEILTRS